MGALKVTLVRSVSGHTARHRQTVLALGLTRRGMTRVLPDTPSTRGMIQQVGYLLEVSETSEDFKAFGRPRTRKPFECDCEHCDCGKQADAPQARDGEAR